MMEKYVKDVQLHRAGVYMEWGCSTLDSGAVGLTQPELFKVLQKKVKKPVPECGQDANWLFVIDGVGLSRVLGLMFSDTLNTYGRVNKALSGSPYERAYLSCRSSRDQNSKTLNKY